MRNKAFICGELPLNSLEGIELYRELQAHLIDLGYRPTVPHDIFEEQDTRILTDDDLQRMAISEMMCCDLVVTTENWYKDKNASLQVQHARLAKLPVVFCHKLLPFPEYVKQNS